MFGEYYFFNASNKGADRRVMGIALAVEPLQGWSGFCLHQTIYTLGAPWIKSAEVGSGQLYICTYMPCDIFTARICFLPLRAVVQVRALV